MGIQTLMMLRRLYRSFVRVASLILVGEGKKEVNAAGEPHHPCFAGKNKSHKIRGRTGQVDPEI